MKLLGKALAAFMIALGGQRWLTSLSSEDPPPVQAVAALERGPRHLKQVALTFDTGVGTEGLHELLASLASSDVTATFFLDGRWASANPACAGTISAGGHVIGNLSWGHKNLTNLEDWEIKREILLADDRFVSRFGSGYQPLFRAPFGATDERVLRIAAELGFHTIGWTLAPVPTGPGQESVSAITRQILDLEDGQLCGAIVRLDVGSTAASAAVPVIVHELRKRGFKFVPVSAWTSSSIAATAGSVRVDSRR